MNGRMGFTIRFGFCFCLPKATERAMEISPAAHRLIEEFAARSKADILLVCGDVDDELATAMIERYFHRLKSETGDLVTLKTAAGIASDFVAKLLAPVYSQVDPFRIGENDLAMRVARDYGERLAKRSGNLRSRQALNML